MIFVKNSVENIYNLVKSFKERLGDPLHYKAKLLCIFPHN